jgi:hypothetical protein
MNIKSVSRKLLLFISLIIGSQYAKAQELNCSVTVNSTQISGTDRKIYTTMQKAFFEFLNGTKWTNDIFKTDERIECSMLINVTERPAVDEFKATMQLQIRRPVYKASYSSTILNYNDNDFTFKYVEFQPIVFAENTFTDNLSSMLSFYAYMIIGIDYDSFSLMGGQPYFIKAQTVVNNAQAASDKGWKSFDSDKNRYWFNENIMNSNFKLIRQTMYKYHRTGLDIMSTKLEEGRNIIEQSLQELKTTYSITPNSYLMQVFFNAKSDEIVNIFSQANSEQKAKLLNTLNLIDPGNTSKYSKIMNN